MHSKNTILAKKDAFLLEKAILNNGKILNIKDLTKIFSKEYTKASAHNRISFLIKTGWLMRIKRGLYLIIDKFTARSQSDISLLQISNALRDNSYISLNAALNYYQMFDQYSKTITAITDEESKQYNFAGHIFKFSSVSKNFYFGFNKKMESGKIIKIADAEKALIDYLYLDSSFYSANLVFEKLKNYQESLDMIKLQDYATRANITAQRKVGFLLDKLNIGTTILYNAVKDKKGYSRFTKDSKLFNAKWRIYYDNRIIR